MRDITGTTIWMLVSSIAFGSFSLITRKKLLEIVIQNQEIWEQME
jgi:hypothetical protein